MCNTLDAISTMIITGHVVDDIGYQMLEFSDSFRCHLHIPLLDKDYYTMFCSNVHNYFINLAPSAERQDTCAKTNLYCAHKSHEQFVHAIP